MTKSLFILLIATILLVIVNENPIEAAGREYDVFCYYESWTKLQTGKGKFTVKDIDSSLCTHITVSFIGLNTDGTINELDSGPYADFMALRNQNTALKLLVSLGGFSQDSLLFSTAVASPTIRTNVVQNIYNFVTRNKFDGIDIDWLYPALNGGSVADKVNFITFLKELRATLGNGLLISAAVGATKAYIDSSYDVKNMNMYLDYINLRTFNLHDFHEGETGENSPLYAHSSDSEHQRNQEACVNAWLQAGASPHKLLLGIPLYGQSYTLGHPSNHGIKAPALGPGTPGKYSKQAGILTNLEICELRMEGDWTEVWDDEQKTPYAYKGNQWVGFENQRSVQEKVQFAKGRNLAGVMVMAMDEDDHANVCGNGKYPLLSNINEFLGRLTRTHEVVKIDPNFSILEFIANAL